MIRIISCALLFIMASFLGTEGSAQAPDATVQFARDVRPILSENCYECHGPDDNQREADLRLDQREGLFAAPSGVATVAAGQPDQSELLRRIISEDEDERMPPPDTGKRLAPVEIAAIRRWIEQGAPWQSHWSFVAPLRPPLPSPVWSPAEAPHVPAVWPRNAIDSFVLDRLVAEGLAPSPEECKRTLIRRVALDLTGVPPTPSEIARFLADGAPDAYERLVDRLLASPRYGERMASVWLDAARYADSYGYQDDGEVSMWRWRDWVIKSFNDNLPFDQFTIEQLAGDLLPDATLEQRIATGFNRNHRANSEGGAIPEEFRVEYVVDRVDTTATTWLGMTMVCARCHDHKYDPISQREFYQLFAFFNNVPEDGRARKRGNTPPLIAAPTRKQQQRQQRLEADLRSARDRLDQLAPEISQAQAEWERTAAGARFDEFTVTRALEARFRLDHDDPGEPRHNSTASTNQIIVRDGQATFCLGRLDHGLQFDGQLYLDAGEDVGGFSDDDKFSLAAWVRPDRETGAILSHLEVADDPKSKGYSLLLRNGRLRFHLVSQWADDAIRVATETALEPGRWAHVLVTYDASSSAGGVHIYVNGVAQPLTIALDSLFQGFSANSPVRIGTGGASDGRFQGVIDDVRIYEDALTANEARLLATPDSIAELLRIASRDRTPLQAEKLRTFFLEYHASPSLADAKRQVDKLECELQELRERFPTVMVMEECPQRRPTRVLLRGRYDAPGDEVSPDVPSVLPPLPPDAPRNRLGLARWLVQPDQPLTARVTVNRLWQMSFGTGLVKTAEDFGAQGAPPSHPRLLDWLATELIRTGWDLKAIRRFIVTSATYRQVSRATPELWALDPENRQLARGPRFRLPAEMIRDQALFVSGLLVEKLGGPSVRPYQPPRLWAELTEDEYEQQHGENLYRRSLYTFWKRTIPHPAMMALDAVDRETCTVRKGRTNTPLQGLALLNEAGFVEAARVLAERVLSERELDTSQMLARAFQLVTGRHPRDAEQQLLLASFHRHRQHYVRRPEEARELVSVGEKPLRMPCDVAELAAMTTVTNMLLNLDETVTQH